MTYERLLEPVGIRSKHGIHQMVARLISRGFLEWIREGRRRLTVKRRLETITAGTPLGKHDYIDFVHGYQIRHDGASPSIREIRDHLGLTNNDVMAMTERLEREGLIDRTIGGRILDKIPDRMIYIVKRPDAPAAA